jgi:uncharacterized protein YfaT (DUF1175 family)
VEVWVGRSALVATGDCGKIRDGMRVVCGCRCVDLKFKSYPPNLKEKMIML